MNPLSIILAALAVYLAFRINIIFGVLFTAVAGGFAYFKLRPRLAAGKADAAYSMGDKDGAVEYYKKAASLAKNSPDILCGYALMLLRCERPSEALEQINLLLSSLNLPLNVKLQAKQIRAMINYKLKNFDDAYEEASDVYESGVTTSAMRGLLGMLMLSSEKDDSKTLAFCEESFDYDTDNRDILDNYLLILTKTKHYDRAKEISDLLLNSTSDFPEAYLHSAQLFSALGDKQTALELLSKADECKFSYMSTVTPDDFNVLRSSL